MARNFVGVFRSGSSAAAGRGGTASTTTSSAATAIVSSPNFNPLIVLPAITNSRSSWPNWMVAPLSCSSLTAGSIKTELKPSRAIKGRQAWPPQQGFPHDRAGKARRALRRVDVERGQQQRLYQPLVQRAS